MVYFIRERIFFWPEMPQMFAYKKSTGSAAGALLRLEDNLSMNIGGVVPPKKYFLYSIKKKILCQYVSKKFT